MTKEIPTFSLKDRDGWELTILNNQDPYGFTTVRYAARWANIMERDMATGRSVSDVAKNASHEADDDGITGFMYGCAVGLLSKAWTHGEELRRWNNIDIQIGNEGEKANESGGVLNPALMTIGTKFPE